MQAVTAGHLRAEEGGRGQTQVARQMQTAQQIIAFPEPLCTSAQAFTLASPAHLLAPLLAMQGGRPSFKLGLQEGLQGPQWLSAETPLSRP